MSVGNSFKRRDFGAPLLAAGQGDVQIPPEMEQGLEARLAAPQNTYGFVGVPGNADRRDVGSPGAPEAFAEANELPSIGHTTDVSLSLSQAPDDRQTRLSVVRRTRPGAGSNSNSLSHSDDDYRGNFREAAVVSVAVKSEVVGASDGSAGGFSARGGLDGDGSDTQPVGDGSSQHGQRQQQQQQPVRNPSLLGSSQGMDRSPGFTDERSSNPRRSKKYSKGEDQIILQQQQTGGGAAAGLSAAEWEEVARLNNLDRTGKSLQDRHRLLMKKRSADVAQVGQATDESDAGSAGERPSEPIDVDAASSSRANGGAARGEPAAKRQKTKQQPTIDNLFRVDPLASGGVAVQPRVSNEDDKFRSLLDISVGDQASAADIAGVQRKIQKAVSLAKDKHAEANAEWVQVNREKEKMAQLRRELDSQREALEQKESELFSREDDLRHGWEADQHRERAQHVAEREQSHKATVAIIQRLAEAEHEASRLVVARNSDRLGRIGHEKHGIGPSNITEVWVEGYQFSDLRRRLEDVKLEILRIEATKKIVSNRRKRRVDEARLAQMFPEIRTSEERQQMLANCHLTEAAMLTAQAESLKRDETQLLRDLDALNNEKNVHIREIKRCKDEDGSAYCSIPRPTLHNDRYVLMNLLGKGGFSEVFKAFDTQQNCFVALKLHQLSESWSTRKKENYIKHAEREYKIQRSLSHPNIVKLVDSFTINKGVCFATVLEYCEGPDLDMYLKRVGRLAEKEARPIMIQVFAALAYFDSQPTRIIHYDLKPGNIIFARGGSSTSRWDETDPANGSAPRVVGSRDVDIPPIACVKVTDFGLSKEADDDTGSVDLTSQGAGTYWYLPPECFPDAAEMQRTQSPVAGDAHAARPPPVRITNKVDVWSAGVILYQMVFGTKPFGHNLSQQRILQEGVIGRSTLSFPIGVQVSDTCKDFIRRCLTPSVANRPDVSQCLLDDFLNPNAKLVTRKKQMGPPETAATRR